MLKYTKIGRAVQELPADGVSTYVATEKLDGANFQIAINPKGEVSYFKRNSKAMPDENFYGYQEVVSSEEVKGLVSEISRYYNDVYGADWYESIHLFGELFGYGIQKRIPYFTGGKRAIVFFDLVMVSNGTASYLSYQDLEALFEDIGYSHLLIPVVVKGTWQEMLDFDIETFKSVVADNDTLAEGVVIKPYDTVIYDYNDSPVFLKRKSVAFEEMKPTPKVRDVHPQEEIFLDYINENRMLSCFSKEGEISHMSQIGTYIKIIIEDAWQDFVEDYPEEFDQKKKIIGMGGKKIAGLLMGFMGV